MNIGKLTSAALQAKIAGGWKAGNPELSKLSEKGRQVLRDKADKFALEIEPHIVNAAEAGVTSYNGIAALFNSLGVRTMRGGSWSAQTVKRIVVRLNK